MEHPESGFEKDLGYKQETLKYSYNGKTIQVSIFINEEKAKMGYGFTMISGK